LVPPMLLPLKTLDCELSACCLTDLEVPGRYRAARVLFRWQGLPLGSVTLPVTNGRLRQADLAAALSRELPRTAAPVLAARSLGAGGRGAPPFDAGATAGDSPAAAPTISLVICTRDRPVDLALCL